MRKSWRNVLLAVVLTVCVAAGYFCRAQYRAVRRLEAWANLQQQDMSAIAALKKPVDLKEGELPLNDFTAILQTQTGVVISIDEDSLNQVSVLPTQPVRVQSTRAGLSAESQLTLALKDLELCWIAKDGQILVTTPERAEALQFVVATYALPAADLEATVDAQSWTEAITSIIEPASWDDVGGRGHCAAVGGALVVAHRADIHRQIQALFDGLRTAGSPPASWQPIRLDPDMNHPADTTAMARLQRVAKLNCTERRLQDVIKHLAAEYDVPLVLSRKKLEEASVSSDTPITISIADVTLESLLRHILKNLELTYVVRGGVVQITTPEDAESQLLLVGHPIHDLASVRGGRDYDSLIELITSTIKPDSWDDVGGPGAIECVAGWLLIPQTEEVHRQIESLLNDLRQPLALGPPTTVFHKPERRESAMRIADVLKRPLQAVFHERPLSHVCDEFASRLGVNVRISVKKLEEAAVSVDTPITCDFPVAAAAVQLRRILEPLELTYVIRDEAVLITTPEDEESQLTTRVYDVRPLLDNDVGLFRTSGPRQDYDRLIEMITGIINSDSWDDVGGPGGIEIFRGLLVVSQTEAVQAEVARFLDELRRAMRWGDQPEVMPTTEPSAAEKRIAQALEREITLDYDETPLVEVARDLSQRLGTVVHLAAKKLEEASISLETPVTGKFPAAPAAVQLARLREELDLRLVVRNDLMTITTPEDLGSSLRVRIYDARSLDLPSGRPQRGSHRDGLIDLITDHVGVDSWDDVGGPGSIDGVNGVLVISHTDEIQHEVAALLDALHRLRETRLSDDPELPRAIWVVPDEVEERIYERLAEPLNIHLWQMPLDRALVELSRVCGVPMRLDRQALSDISVAHNATVSVTAEQITLASALDRLLPDGVQYALCNRELLVTSASACDTLLRLRLYRVDDLETASEANIERLCDQIAEEVQPDRWELAGGPCSVSDVHNGWILVTADTATHERLDDWFANRRTGEATPRARERAEWQKQPEMQ